MKTGRADTSPGHASGSAVMSPCGDYRYLLTRTFDTGDDRLLFVMLNPSAADACADDPTIRRCMQFARRWGYSELRVVNLFALRTSDPRNLTSAKDPVGPGNDTYLLDELDTGCRVIGAWGNGGALDNRAGKFWDIAGKLGIEVECLGTNRTGQPTHPLYVPLWTLPGMLTPHGTLP